MTDEPNNVMFLQVVQRFPCLYDTTRNDYSNREIGDKAWARVANEVNDSVPKCKEKWKNLRTALARSIKHPATGRGVHSKYKEYYLKNVMDFVLPFMKAKKHRCGPLQSLESNASVFDSALVDSESLLQEVNSTMSDQICDMESFTNVKPIKREREGTVSQEESNYFIDEVISLRKDDSNLPYSNADLDFLKSLLPDLSKMNDYQKRLFKRRTLETIDSILCDGPSDSGCSSTPIRGTPLRNT